MFPGRPLGRLTSATSPGKPSGENTDFPGSPRANPREPRAAGLARTLRSFPPRSRTRRSRSDCPCGAGQPLRSAGRHLPSQGSICVAAVSSLFTSRLPPPHHISSHWAVPTRSSFTLRPTGPSSRFLCVCLVPSRGPPACFPRGSASPFEKCPLGSAEAATAPALASRSPLSQAFSGRRAVGSPGPPAQPPWPSPGSLRCQAISPEHRRLHTLTSSFAAASGPGVSPPSFWRFHPLPPPHHSLPRLHGRLQDCLPMTERLGGWERRQEKLVLSEDSRSTGIHCPGPPQAPGPTRGGRGQDCHPGSPLASA